MHLIKRPYLKNRIDDYGRRTKHEHIMLSSQKKTALTKEPFLKITTGKKHFEKYFFLQKFESKDLFKFLSGI